jgi:1-acyl-sn-glycerol-3-phosphate acyltransferase
MPTFSDLLKNFYDKEPERVALYVLFSGQPDRPLTYRQLLQGAAAYARAFEQHGVQPGEVVVLILQHSYDLIYAFFGAVLHGAIPSIMPFLTEKLLPERYRADLAALVAITQPSAIVTYPDFEAEVHAALQQGANNETSVRSVIVSDKIGVPLDPDFATLGGMRRSPQDIVLLQHSSGTTGLQKGVALTHQAVFNQLESYSQALHLVPEDVIVSWLPLYHDMGLIGAWLAPLYFGLPVVMLSPVAFLSRPARWLRAFDLHRGTLGAAPNFAYELAAAKISDAELEGLDLSSWRAALNGAEPVLPATLDRFAERFARCGFRREALLPVYGLAESSVAVTIPQPGRGPRVDRIERAAFEYEGRAVPAAPDAQSDDADVISFVSVGRAIPRHEVRVANDSGGDAGERVEGQLWFRGPSATRGYYRNDAATAALFPQGAAEGWINSGDRAYRAEGEIYITGRVKDIIIHAGRNLYPHEIEGVVAQVPGVRKGCVVAFGAADRTTGTERLVIVAETRERDREARARIEQAITAHISITMGLPPDVVTVIPPNSIPKTSSGKLQRDATKKKFLSGELGSTASPVWLQITRLAVVSSAGRIRPALRRAGEIVYGCYAIALLGVVVVSSWLLVLAAPSRQAAARITTAALRAFLALGGWRVRVEGREHMRDSAPSVFVSNHTSYADVIVLMAALGVDYHFVAKNEVASMPFIRTFLRKLGHFAFDRQDSRARLQQADEIEQALQRGESVFVFAEGTFTAQAGVRPFQLGAFKAAVAAKRPVVPVALKGTRRALRDGTWLPRLSRITITICPPIFPQADAPAWRETMRVRNATREMIARYAGEPLL